MRAALLAIVPAALALGVLAYEVQVSTIHSPAGHAAAQVAVGLAFVFAGLIAWARRRGNRLGPLMIAAGVALLVRQLRYDDDALAFTCFFLLGELGYALVGHTALAYPSGHLTERPERWLVRVGYATVIVYPLAILLVHDEQDPLPLYGPLFRKSDFQVASSSVDTVANIYKAYVLFFFGVLAVCFIALVLRRLYRATPRSRRILAPLLLAAIAVALRAVFEVVFTFFDRPFAYDVLFWWQVVAFLALPVALLAGLLRARLARSTVGDLVIQLERTPPQGLRDTLARGLGDPTLEVMFWLPERRSWVDAEGRAAELPQDSTTRGVTLLEHGSEPLAALVHDPSLRDEPQLVEGAAAAARLALENARLSAEVHAQLTTVNESRARIVSATDAERRRIERDIHDGAQQRLVALALELRTAQRRLGADTDPEVEQVLVNAIGELQTALDELRELARGVHPAILTEEGLAAALESLVLRSPVPAELAEAPEQRFAPEIEATAYFVACESLANVVKHSGATAATVRVHVAEERLVIEVSDDGVGGADSTNGTGLRGLTDRVDALGGTLAVSSPADGGTRVVGEIPCAS
jgi:signal transduction histidine kinase